MTPLPFPVARRSWPCFASASLLLAACAAPPAPAPAVPAAAPRVPAPEANVATPKPAAPAPPTTVPDAGTPAPPPPTTVAAAAEPAPPPPMGPGWSIVTTAPDGITAADLGRVFDAAFQPLAGSGPLFKAKAPEGYPEFRHSVALVQDRVTLAATVRSWGLGADAARTRRFASYRAEQVTEIRAVDDMTAPRSAPPAAMYYLAKVFYGRSFEVRLSGDEKQFNSGLAGTFLSGKLEGGLKTFAEKNRLEFTAVGRGLRPKRGTAIYAKQPSDIEENYTVEGTTTVPIAVEYRLIPGRALPATDPIVWRKPVRYRLELSAVEARHCDRTSACDLSVAVAPVEGGEKAKTYRGPDDVDAWEPRYLLLETSEESELQHGLSFEVADRNLTGSRVLGRCQARADQRRLRSVNESPDRRIRWTELCGKAQIRLTLTAEDAQ
jgi:hypothetical protein